MTYAVGMRDGRWIGYGVPAQCDHPDCTKAIDRGMGYICGDEWGDPGEPGCGLFFCPQHGGGALCERCEADKAPFHEKPDSPEWIDHMLTDESWKKWRKHHPEWVAATTRRP